MPARSSAHLIAIAPSSVAFSGASPPRNAPIGVRAAPRITTSLMPKALLDVFAVRADLVAQRAQLAHAHVERPEVSVEELHEPRQHAAVRAVTAVQILKLQHLLEREPQSLELADVPETAEVVVGIDADAALEPLDRLEETKLLVVADGPLGKADTRRELADPVLPDRSRHRTPLYVVRRFVRG